MLAAIDSQRVAQNFAAAAAGYDQYAALQREIARQLKAQWPALSPAAKVMDLGCGTGHDSEWLSRQHQLTLVDIAEGMLEVAASRCPDDLPRYCSDVAALGSLGLVCDAIWSGSMLQWVADMPAAAAEIYSSLKPGGQLVASLFTEGSLAELAAAWKAVDNEPHVLSLPPIDATREAFEAAGFRVSWQRPFTRALHFDGLAEISQHLRGLGATNALQRRKKGLMGRQQLRQLTAALETYRRPEGIALTWNAWLFVAERPL